MNKKEFVAKFDAAATARPRQGDQADRFGSFLRGYAATINDYTFAEAADFIDELFGELYLANEELAGYRGQDSDEADSLQIEPGSLSKEETLALVRSPVIVAKPRRPL